jgi:hypothetical protein
MMGRRRARCSLVPLVVSMTLAWPAAALADWAPISTTQMNSANTSVVGLSAASVGGIPYVAWSESPAANPTTGPVYVSKLSNASFSAVGGGAVAGCTADPVITDIGGTPYLACIDGSAGTIEVDTLSGSTWTPVGSAITVADEGAGIELGGIADVGGLPYVAFVPPITTPGSQEVMVYGYSGGQSGHWSQIGSPLIGHSGDQALTPALLSDGSTPIVAWTETTPAGSLATTQYVFADQLHGTTWSPLNGGDAIGASTGSTPQLDGLTMIGTTPYLAVDESTSSGGEAADAFALAGSSFAPAGGTIVSSTSSGIAPQAALGSYDGGPLAIVNSLSSENTEQISARTYTGSTWSQLGSVLGVPPLPSTGNGDPYGARAIAVDSQTGTPYVAFLQQSNSTATAVPPEDLFVESYTAGGTNPTKPFTGNPTPPTVTPGTLTGPAPGSVKSIAATLELAGAATLKRRGKSVEVATGIRAACPAETSRAACTGHTEIHIGAVEVTVPFTVGTRRAIVLTTSLSGTTLRRLGRAGRLVRGTIIVTITGPNGASTSVSQRLRARLPAA